MVKPQKRAASSSSCASASEESLRLSSRKQKAAKRQQQQQKQRRPQQERQQEQEQQQQHDNTMIPVGAFKGLPDEVLSRIVNYCCGWALGRSTVTNLSMTCRRFRHVINNPVLVPYKPWPVMNRVPSLSHYKHGRRCHTNQSEEPCCIVFSTDHTRMVVFDTCGRKRGDGGKHRSGRLMVYDKIQGLLGIIRCCLSSNKQTMGLLPIFSPDNHLLVYMDDDSKKANNDGTSHYEIKICRLPTQQHCSSVPKERQHHINLKKKKMMVKKLKDDSCELFPHHHKTPHLVTSLGFINRTTVAMIMVNDNDEELYVYLRFRFNSQNKDDDVEVVQVEETPIPSIPQPGHILSYTFLAPVCVGKNHDIMVRVHFRQGHLQDHLIEFWNTKTWEIVLLKHVPIENGTSRLYSATVTKDGYLVVAEVHYTPSGSMYCTYLYFWDCSRATLSDLDIGNDPLVYRVQPTPDFDRVDPFPDFRRQCMSIAAAPTSNHEQKQCNIVFNFYIDGYKQIPCPGIAYLGKKPIGKRAHGYVYSEWENATSWNRIAA